MAQNPWIIRKCDGIKFRKVEKWCKSYNEENKHLMHLPTFEKIQNTLRTVLKYRQLASEKETFQIASVRCVASVKPQNAFNILDGLRMYLSHFMLKANHDFDGYCLCFRRIKVIKKQPRTINGISCYLFLGISFKLLFINLRRGLTLKTRLIKIESSQLTLDVFGVAKGIVFNNNALSEFYTDGDKVVLKNRRRFALKDIVLVVINRLCYSEDGIIVHIIGKIVEPLEKK